MKMKLMGGMKFLNRQMVPLCFQVTGDGKVAGGGSRSGRSIKLVKWDGVVIIYRRPIHVWELMLDFPADAYMVCRSDSFYIGQKIPALADDDQLQLGHTYFLLPTHVFRSVLSFLTIASFTSSSQPHPNSKNALLRKAATCQPFVLQKSPSGGLRIRVSEDFVSELLTEQAQSLQEEEASASTKPNPKPTLCTTPQLQKDYTLLVVSRNWKPKLETIKESTKKKKAKKLASFGIKRRKNSKSIGSPKARNIETPATTSVPSRPVS